MAGTPVRAQQGGRGARRADSVSRRAPGGPRAGRGAGRDGRRCGRQHGRLKPERRWAAGWAGALRAPLGLWREAGPRCWAGCAGGLGDRGGGRRRAGQGLGTPGAGTPPCYRRGWLRVARRVSARLSPSPVQSAAGAATREAELNPPRRTRPGGRAGGGGRCGDGTGTWRRPTPCTPPGSRRP